MEILTASDVAMVIALDEHAEAAINLLGLLDAYRTEHNMGPRDVLEQRLVDGARARAAARGYSKPVSPSGVPELRGIVTEARRLVALLAEGDRAADASSTA